MGQALRDAIHCLRSALDYVISDILGGGDTRTTFPMDETRDALKNSFRTTPKTVGQRTIKIGRNARIEKAVPGTGDFITDTIKS